MTAEKGLAVTGKGNVMVLEYCCNLLGHKMTAETQGILEINLELYIKVPVLRKVLSCSTSIFASLLYSLMQYRRLIDSPLDLCR